MNEPVDKLTFACDLIVEQQKRIAELEKEIEAHERNDAANYKIMDDSSKQIAEIEKERDELKSTNRVLDNQLNELYHAMELISKIATVAPRDTAILEVINCYRTGELLKAHNLEQQAKGIRFIATQLAEHNMQAVVVKEGLLTYSDQLLEKAKQLREGVK